MRVTTRMIADACGVDVSTVRGWRIPDGEIDPDTRAKSWDLETAARWLESRYPRRAEAVRLIAPARPRRHPCGAPPASATAFRERYSIEPGAMDAMEELGKRLAESAMLNADLSDEQFEEALRWLDKRWREWRVERSYDVGCADLDCPDCGFGDA